MEKLKMEYKVICGNNVDLLKIFPDNHFDSIVTDPPYGLGKEPIASDLMKDWIEKGYHEISGSGFMGKEWDAFVPQPIFWKEVFRVLKPGGHVLAFYGTRTYDWGVMAMRFAGFEVRDCIQWLYGSGFPKSHNISKAIEGKLLNGSSNPRDFKKLEGEKSITRLGTFNNIEKTQGKRENDVTGRETTINHKITTDQAKQWDGWGSALKPANEPIVLARKPLEKGLSIAENILKWGVGGINIDASRIGVSENDPNHRPNWENHTTEKKGDVYGVYEKRKAETLTQGRFPANIILTHHEDCECKGTKKVKGQKDKPTNRTKFDGTWNEGNTGLRNNTNLSKEGFADENGQEEVENWHCHEDCPIKILDEQSGVSKTGDIKPHKEKGTGTIYGNGNGFFSSTDYREVNFKGDKGGASRFFYVAKASKSERNKGLDGFEEKNKPDNYIMPKLTCSECGSKRIDSSNRLVCGCNGKTHYEEQNSIESKNNLSGGNKNHHPTVKPIKLMQYLVKMITPPNGIVLDPFCGSGTTGVACKLDGFQFVGLEQDPEYFRIAEARINNIEVEKESQLKLF
jgi:site-specific DNA-methyltransferase (adenine-specific)